MTRPRCFFALLILAATLSCSAPLRAEEGATLQGAAAWAKLVGNTVMARTSTGATYTDYYGADGTVRHRDGDGTANGTWSRNGDTTCFDYPDDDERVCVTVRLTGMSGTFTESGGAQDTFDLLPGNPDGL